MNGYVYYPVQYQPMAWPAIFALLVDMASLVAVGAWALSMGRAALKGEEVKLLS